MHKCKLTNQERIAAVKEYLDGHGSYATIAGKYGIDRTTLRAAVNLFISQGEHALYTTSKNTHYSPELKRQAVEAYLSGEGSQQYGVSCNQIYNWVRKYEEKGIDGLVDRRGKAKPEADRLKAENRILKAKLRSIQLEEDLRKKLAEIERRHR